MRTISRSLGISGGRQISPSRIVRARHTRSYQRGPKLQKESTIMLKSAVLCSLALIAMPSVVIGQQSSVTHKWKFPTTVNAPWAMEGDQKPLDTPSSAAGLCRSTPFSTTGVYGPLGSAACSAASCLPSSSGAIEGSNYAYPARRLHSPRRAHFTPCSIRCAGESGWSTPSLRSADPNMS